MISEVGISRGRYLKASLQDMSALSLKVQNGTLLDFRGD